MAIIKNTNRDTIVTSARGKGVVFYNEDSQLPFSVFASLAGRSLLNNAQNLGVEFNETEADCIARGELEEANSVLEQIGVKVFTVEIDGQYGVFTTDAGTLEFVRSSRNEARELLQDTTPVNNNVLATSVALNYGAFTVFSGWQFVEVVE